MTEQILFKGTPGTWEIVDGTLPQGLELNTETGEVTGYPEEFGTFQIRVRFTNTCGQVEKDINVYTCTTPEILSDNIIFNMDESLPGGSAVTGCVSLSDFVAIEGGYESSNDQTELTGGDWGITKIEGTFSINEGGDSPVVYNIDSYYQKDRNVVAVYNGNKPGNIFNIHITDEWIVENVTYAGEGEPVSIDVCFADKNYIPAH